jgi:thiosulfate/3-mercaptopyruvate sulfurtransferase
VAYDDSFGSIAGRLWWMLRWLGHDAVAVLDGGVRAWTEAGGTLTAEIPRLLPKNFVPNPRPAMVVSAEDVMDRSPNTALIDSRAPDRYAGLNEPIDPVAGHIPGALNRNWADGLGLEGRFKSAADQQARFADLPENTIVYCGSGVSACANLLAMELGGVKGVLYAGSWSDWSSDAHRPVAKGSGK